MKQKKPFKANNQKERVIKRKKKTLTFSFSFLDFGNWTLYIQFWKKLIVLITVYTYIHRDVIIHRALRSQRGKRWILSGPHKSQVVGSHRHFYCVTFPFFSWIFARVARVREDDVLLCMWNLYKIDMTWLPFPPFIFLLYYYIYNLFKNIVQIKKIVSFAKII